MDAIEMYFLNRIRPDLAADAEGCQRPLLERQGAWLIRAATLLQIALILMLNMSALGGKADIADRLADVR